MTRCVPAYETGRLSDDEVRWAGHVRGLIGLILVLWTGSSQGMVGWGPDFEFARQILGLLTLRHLMCCRAHSRTRFKLISCRVYDLRSDTNTEDLHTANENFFHHGSPFPNPNIKYTHEDPAVSDVVNADEDWAAENRHPAIWKGKCHALELAELGVVVWGRSSTMAENEWQTSLVIFQDLVANKVRPPTACNRHCMRNRL